MFKKIIPFIDCRHEVPLQVIEEAVAYEVSGGDGIYIYNYAQEEAATEDFLKTAKEVAKVVEFPIFVGSPIKRFEDIKKALYTGASYVVVKQSDYKEEIIIEGANRFGKDKIIILIEDTNYFSCEYGNRLLSAGVCGIFLANVKLEDNFKNEIEEFPLPVYICDSLMKNDITELLVPDKIHGITTDFFKEKDLYNAKSFLKAEGIDVNLYESNLFFSQFKLNSDGMVPVVVQDYKSSEVLMVAYMNEEAFDKTVTSGKMTYFSRSRNELWIKGETSGHYQYVKELLLDCDKDTLLAKVKQIGAACHTGNRSCFYTSLVKKEYDSVNPLTVFNDVYDVIIDRKNNPKAGSYTNYLFDKGIDKILKKCGEEATEMVIAAKNPDAEELKYEISDFLYHMMVLMAECNLDWNDILKELAHRR
ncbi:MAG: phosphoribosyl-ATP diphosphatase [Anaerocolumna sp.]|jgi:phosphoribosyl-ATP pyrophosphohydrolase/phosphoribosyl-AMP cyclohydrolase|nr:phosphoribosyl-ATP diphosphatase [Anaerocolumna sp.]